MPPKRLTRCEETVWDEKKKVFKPCGRASTRKIDGTYYCALHDPIRKGERKEQANKRRAARMEALKIKINDRQWEEYQTHPYILSMQELFNDLQGVLRELVVLKTVIKQTDPVLYQKSKELAWKKAQLTLLDVDKFNKFLESRVTDESAEAVE